PQAVRVRSNLALQNALPSAAQSLPGVSPAVRASATRRNPWQQCERRGFPFADRTHVSYSAGLRAAADTAVPALQFLLHARWARVYAQRAPAIRHQKCDATLPANRSSPTGSDTGVRLRVLH